jgi:hypothetical protein
MRSWTGDRVMQPMQTLARIHQAIQADHAYAPPAYA